MIFSKLDKFSFSRAGCAEKLPTEAVGEVCTICYMKANSQRQRQSPKDRVTKTKTISRSPQVGVVGGSVCHF